MNSLQRYVHKHHSFSFVANEICALFMAFLFCAASQIFKLSKVAKCFDGNFMIMKIYFEEFKHKFSVRIEIKKLLGSRTRTMLQLLLLISKNFLSLPSKFANFQKLFFLKCFFLPILSHFFQVHKQSTWECINHHFFRNLFKNRLQSVVKIACIQFRFCAQRSSQQRKKKSWDFSTYWIGGSERRKIEKLSQFLEMSKSTENAFCQK